MRLIEKERHFDDTGIDIRRRLVEKSCSKLGVCQIFSQNFDVSCMDSSIILLLVLRFLNGQEGKQICNAFRLFAREARKRKSCQQVVFERQTIKKEPIL